MKYTILGIFLLLLGGVDGAKEERLALLSALDSVNKKIIESLQVENKSLKKNIAESRTIIKNSIIAKQTLISELESLQEKYAALEFERHKKKAINITKTLFAVIGLPVGILAGWGIRDLQYKLKG